MDVLVAVALLVFASEVIASKGKLGNRVIKPRGASAQLRNSGAGLAKETARVDTEFPGQGQTIRRVLILLFAVLPLFGIAYFAQSASDASTGLSKVLIFTSAILVASFAYDVLKTVLIMQQNDIYILFRSFSLFLTFLVVFFLLVVIIAWFFPTSEITKSYPAIILVVLTFIFMYLATRTFLKTVQYAMRPDEII